METLFLQRGHPINRKQRLLEYVKVQDKRTRNEAHIEQEIEVAFEELLEEPEYFTNIATSTPVSKTNVHQSKDNYPAAKRQKTSEFSNLKLEGYSEKFRSVVEQAMLLNQQLRDVTTQGITVCEDADVSLDDAKADVVRENSPVQEEKRIVAQQENKPAKKILHVTGDHILEYYEDEGIAGDDCQKENISLNSKESTQHCRPSVKKTTKKLIHITGDCSSEDFEKHQISFLNEDTGYTFTSYPRESSDNHEEMIIGPNGTSINKYQFNSINWNLSAPIVTRKLLLNIFGRDILSTHSLTGKPSPAFLNESKPLKKPLDAKKVDDIIYIVTKKMNVKAKEVRLAITSKCADEQKMRKARMSK